jgi:hypothetical protein
MNSIAVASRGLPGKRNGESRRGGIARLVERLTRTAAVWPDAADRASYAEHREAATSDDSHELDLLFQSPEPIR